MRLFSPQHARGFVVALFILHATGTLGACASGEYVGIPLRSGTASAELQALAQRARAGDKEAQFLLGERFEEGRGLPRNIGRARKLYAAAARDTSGTILVYAPATGSSTTGQLMPITQGAPQPGLEIAKRKVAALKASGK